MDLREKLSTLSVRPTKVLKIVIGLSVVLLLMWLVILSQVNYTEGNYSDHSDTAQQQADSVVAGDSLSTTAAQRKYSDDSSTDVFSNGLLTFFVLLVILGGIWLWLQQKESSVSRTKQRELGSQILGEGAQIKIIRINKEIWVLGVTSNSVNLLHRYSEEEWTEKISEEESTKTPIFQKLFRSEMG